MIIINNISCFGKCYFEHWLHMTEIQPLFIRYIEMQKNAEKSTEEWPNARCVRTNDLKQKKTLIQIEQKQQQQQNMEKKRSCAQTKLKQKRKK